jgi:cytochrome P450
MLPDPYPVYQRLRNEDPVHWHEPFGSWVVTRYDDVVAAFVDPRLSSERAGPMAALAGSPDLAPFFSYLACRMDFRDPPEHGRLRRLAQAPFAPHVVETLRPLIQRLVDGFLDSVQGRGRMDVIRDLAYPLPGTVIGELLGVPAADRDRLKKWSDEFVGFFKTVPSQTSREDYRRSDQAARKLGSYFRDVLARHRDGPASGLLDALARAEEGGDRLGTEELSANATLLLHAGHETTTHLIGNGLLALLRQPDQFQRLRTEPSLVPTAVEEFLRYDSPVQLTYRMARVDLEFAGKPIRKGQVVHLVLGAANERLAQHLWKHRDQLLTFLHVPGLDATNWRAELAIRFGVILRKVWGGNRTWVGARAQAVLMSVWRTCWQQGRSALDFLSPLLRGAPLILASPP